MKICSCLHLWISYFKKHIYKYLNNSLTPHPSKKNQINKHYHIPWHAAWIYHIVRTLTHFVFALGAMIFIAVLEAIYFIFGTWLRHRSRAHFLHDHGHGQSCHEWHNAFLAYHSLLFSFSAYDFKVFMNLYLGSSFLQNLFSDDTDQSQSNLYHQCAEVMLYFAIENRHY